MINVIAAFALMILRLFCFIVPDAKKASAVSASRPYLITEHVFGIIGVVYVKR